MFETAILIIIYNKEIIESKTIQSLAKSKFKSFNTRVVIWNNGPKKLKSYDNSYLQDLGYDVVIEETLNNESLAIIYNKFLSMNNSKKYVLLDDDSELTEEYGLECNLLKPSDFGVPIITSGNEIRSPSINNKAFIEDQKINNDDFVTGIGSGLVLGSQFCQNLNESFGSIFDENFYLYGVDTSLFYRINKVKLTSKIKIIKGFNHSLSRLEEESKATKIFRKKELSEDLGLTLRYYVTGLPRLYRLTAIFLGYLRNKACGTSQNIFLTSLLRAFITGKHYRSYSDKK